jgi:DNA (cytosine-5)-methyltransferase 1
LSACIVDAAAYGVPQHRRRAILVAERTGKAFQVPNPTHITNPISVWDALHDVPTVNQMTSDNRHWLELLPTIPEGENYLWHTPRGGGEPLFAYRSRFWSFLLKLAKNRPSWTLSAQPGPYAGPFHWNSRRLTSVEMLRLQSFPPTWQVRGDTRTQTRQIGNATPPLLAEIVGRALKKQYFGARIRGCPSLTLTRSPIPCPKPEPVFPVPRKYHKLRKAWPDHPGTGRGPRPVLENR